MITAPAVGARIVRGNRPVVAYLVACLAAACAIWLTIGTSPAAAFTPNDLSLRATYDVKASIHWAPGTMSVSTVASVTNTTGGRLSALTFNLVTLRTGDARITNVQVDGRPADFTAGGQTIVVTLPTKLDPQAVAKVRIDYEATFNSAPASSHHDLFAKDEGIVAAYRWIPWLSKQQAYDAPNFGETWVTGVSPRLTVTIDSDQKLVFATNGKRTASGAGGVTFSARNVRDFNFSASPNYEVTAVSQGGITIRFYSTSPMAAQVRTWTLRALERFSSRLGAYPYSQLSVAMTPGGSGMESPGMAWISTTEPGTNLAYLAIHEVAHQWFYGAVGNNQANQPFLDEGVADFLTRDTLNSFRKSGCAQARLDRTTYDYSNACYNEVIYVQSSQYLDAYRDKVGNNQFYAGLSDVYRKYKFRITNTRAFWDTLDKRTGFTGGHEDRFPSLYP